jgi:hypothetical protein
MEQKGKSRPKYRRVQVSELNRGRRGKHHELMQGIVQDLNNLETGSALVIPLSEVGGVGLANLRSAVHRSAAAEDIEIETLADNNNFYVWRKERSSAD